jgi:hypothetical protein
LVVDGVVSVTGTVDGVQESASTPVHVTPRDWSAKTTVKDHTVIPTTLSARPAAIEELGNANLSLPLDQDVARWLKVIGDAGPNDGFSYLLDLPPIATSVSQVNTNAINSKSAFYKIQEPQTITIGGVKFCGQNVVAGVLGGLVTQHEGAVANPDVYPNSHPGIFRHHVDSAAYRKFEKVAGPGDPVTPVNSALFNEAVADSKAMDTDSRNYVNTTSLGGCNTFHFDYSHAK